MDPSPPWVFDMLQYFEKTLLLVESLGVLYKLKYILWVAVLLEACDVIQVLPKIRNFKKMMEIDINFFVARHVEYDIIKHFASLCQHFVLLSPKKVKNMHFYSKMA